MRLSEQAILFATHAHAGQVRKYTLEPYVAHPVAVMALVATVPHTEEMLAAAVLHDVLEDTTISLTHLTLAFGPVVSGLVSELTGRGARQSHAARHPQCRSHWRGQRRCTDNQACRPH